jgi:hypothetical protein
MFISNQNQLYTIHIKFTVLWANELLCWREGDYHPATLSRPHKVLDAIFFLDHMARFSWAFLGFSLPLSSWLIGFHVPVVFESVYLLFLSVRLLPLLYGGLYGVFGSRRTKARLLSFLESLTVSRSVFCSQFFTAAICTYIYIHIIQFHLYHTVNIYWNWLQEQFCNLSSHTVPSV